jgi:hypothetical protein
VVECRGTGTDITYTLVVHKLKTNLLLLKTAPSITTAIIKHLQQWRKFGDCALPWFRSVNQWGGQHAVSEQDQLGWYQFLLGRITRTRSDSQQRFLDSLQKQNTSRRWVIFLIQKALDVAWDTWEQRNEININSLHPRGAEEKLAIRTQLQLLHQKGQDRFLLQDRLLFIKTEAILLQGSPIEMLQWISSVLNATRHAAISKDDLEATMQAERGIL